MNKTLKNEIFVATHAQPLWLRLLKYPVFLGIAAIIYFYFGWRAVVYLFTFLVIAGTSLHFLLRWKTKGWTRSWGPYHKIKLPK